MPGLSWGGGRQRALPRIENDRDFRFLLQSRRHPAFSSQPEDKAISGLSGGQGLIFAGQPVLLWPPPANPPHFRASQQGKGRFPLAQLQPQQAVLAHRGTAASWADGGAAHGPAYCPCYVAARTYANQSHKTRLFMLFPPSFQNRYHFLSATGDAQPFTKGRRCLV